MRKNNTSKRMKNYMGGRADYRNGGRVQYATGSRYGNVEKPSTPNMPVEMSEVEMGRNIRVPGGGGNIRIPEDILPPYDPPPEGLPVLDPRTDKEIFEEERGERVVDTGRKVQDIALGKNIPIPEQEVQKIERGPDSEALQLGERTGVTASTVDFAGSENVTKADTTTATAATPITTSTMDAAQVDTNVNVDAAQGTVSDEALAEAADVARVPKIDAAEVEIPVGALTNRVVGTLSEESKAVAAKNIGTNLARITRAKKTIK